MAEIILRYDARNSLAKRTIEYILSLGVFERIGKNTKNTLNKNTLEAIKEAETGNAEEISLQDFRKQLYS